MVACLTEYTYGYCVILLWLLCYIVIHFLNSEQETQIINYKMQQFKLLPGLATAYAIRFALYHVMSLYQEAQKRISAGDLSILPEV